MFLNHARHPLQFPPIPNFVLLNRTNMSRLFGHLIVGLLDVVLLGLFGNGEFLNWTKIAFYTMFTIQNSLKTLIDRLWYELWIFLMICFKMFLLIDHTRTSNRIGLLQYRKYYYLLNWGLWNIFLVEWLNFNLDIPFYSNS